jgi:hypothetical protein
LFVVSGSLPSDDAVAVAESAPRASASKYALTVTVAPLGSVGYVQWKPVTGFPVDPHELPAPPTTDRVRTPAGNDPATTRFVASPGPRFETTKEAAVDWLRLGVAGDADADTAMSALEGVAASATWAAPPTPAATAIVPTASSLLTLISNLPSGMSEGWLEPLKADLRPPPPSSRSDPRSTELSRVPARGMLIDP